MQNRLIHIFLLGCMVHCCTVYAQVVATPEQLMTRLASEIEKATVGLEEVDPNAVTAEQSKTSVTLREIRIQDGTSKSATKFLESLLKEGGFTLSLDGNVELDGWLRAKNQYDYLDDADAVLDFEILTSDYTSKCVIGITHSLQSKLIGDEGESQGTMDGTEKTLKPFRTKTVRLPQPGSTLIKPRLEWLTKFLKVDAMRHTKDGVIVSKEKWELFWSYCNSGRPTPSVDFTKEYVLVVAVDVPNEAKASLYDAGPGEVEIVRDDRKDKPATREDAVNAWITVVAMGSSKPRKARLGMTIIASESGDGLIVTEVEPDSPATRGVLSDGRIAISEKGDTIVSVDGRKISDPLEFARIVKNTRDTLILEVRDGNTGRINRIKFQLNSSE